MAAPLIPMAIMAVGSAGLGAAQSAQGQKNQKKSQYAAYLQQRHSQQLAADRQTEAAAANNARQMMGNQAGVISAAVNATRTDSILDRQQVDAKTQSSRRLSDSLAMASASADSRGISTSSGSARALEGQARRRAAREGSAIVANVEAQRASVWNQYDAAVNTAKYANYQGMTTYTPTYSPDQNIDGLAVFAAGAQGALQGAQMSADMFGNPFKKPPATGGV